MENEKNLELLKQAWKEVFEVDDISDDADFFEEGGDSIKAVQLSSWLLQKGLKLDLGRIFYTPVLSQMAETLEETDPVFVPDQLMTKELAGEKLKNIMTGMEGASAPAIKKTSENDQQICDPEEMGASDSQQICDPEEMGASDSQQICDPGTMGVNYSQPAAGYSDPFFNMMTSMLQTMMSQQQVMLQMMQLMMNRMTTPPQMTSFAPSQTTAFVPPQMPDMPVMPKRNSFPGRKGSFQKMSGKRAFRPNDLPPEVMAKLQKEMKQYETRKVDKPIEKPNVIGLKKPTVKKPEKSPQQVLDHVLGGLLKNGFSKTEDLFEQGLTSLDTVKMVTRCAEYGYDLSMQDIYMHSNYYELIKCLKPGK